MNKGIPLRSVYDLEMFSSGLPKQRLGFGRHFGRDGGGREFGRGKGQKLQRSRALGKSRRWDLPIRYVRLRKAFACVVAAVVLLDQQQWVRRRRQRRARFFSRLYHIFSTTANTRPLHVLCPATVLRVHAHSGRQGEQTCRGNIFAGDSLYTCIFLLCTTSDDLHPFLSILATKKSCWR